MAWEDLAGKAIDKIDPAEYRYFWMAALGIAAMVALTIMRKILFVPITVTPDQMSSIVKDAVRDQMRGSDEHIRYLQERIEDLSRKFDLATATSALQHTDNITRLTRLETMARNDHHSD